MQDISLAIGQYYILRVRVEAVTTGVNNIPICGHTRTKNWPR